MAMNSDAELAQQLTAKSAHSDTGGGLTRTGALNDIADVTVTILDGPRKVSMTWTYPRNRVHRRINGRGTHAFFPVDPVEIFDLHSHGRTKGFTVTHA